MAEKPTEKGQRSAKKTDETKKGKFSKTGRILSKNGRLEIFAKSGRFLTKTGGLESLAFLGG